MTLSRSNIWSDWYYLDGKEPMPCQCLEDLNRNTLEQKRVGRDEIGDTLISTVFLGLDHAWHPGGRPLVFETMVFGGPLNGEMDRYTTWDRAEDGHKAIVERVRDAANQATQGEK